MIETVVSMGLPVGERLVIKKNRITPENVNSDTKRIAIVTGTHGDELEGQFVCYELNRRIKEHPEYLQGIVDIYPSLNPLGMDSIIRGIPMFDLDMNRIFPGYEDGPMAETIVKYIVDDLKGADMCVDIHASNIYLKEMPQVRINEETKDWLVPYAKKLNIDFIWVHAAATVLESTLAYSMNQLNVPTLVVEMGVGMRVNENLGYQLVEGILNLMKDMGIWTGPVGEIREPIVSSDHAVGYMNADYPGIYLPKAQIFDEVEEGEVVGHIVDPLTGNVRQEVKAPISGMIFTVREYPIVYSGSLLNRILGGLK